MLQKHLKVTSPGFNGLTKGLLYFKFVQVPHCPSCHALVFLLSWVVEEDQLHISWDCLLVVNILWWSDRPHQQCHSYSSSQSSCFKLVNKSVYCRHAWCFPALKWCHLEFVFNFDNNNSLVKIFLLKLYTVPLSMLSWSLWLHDDVTREARSSKATEFRHTEYSNICCVHVVM